MSDWSEWSEPAGHSTPMRAVSPPAHAPAPWHYSPTSSMASSTEEIKPAVKLHPLPSTFARATKSDFLTVPKQRACQAAAHVSKPLPQVTKQAAPEFLTVPKQRSKQSPPAVSKAEAAGRPVQPHMTKQSPLASASRRDATPALAPSSKSRSRFTPASHMPVMEEQSERSFSDVTSSSNNASITHNATNSTNASNTRNATNTSNATNNMQRDETVIYTSLNVLKDRVQQLERERAEVAKRNEEYESEIMELRSQLSVIHNRPDSALGSDVDDTMEWQTEKEAYQTSIASYQKRLDRSERDASVSDIAVKKIAAERDELDMQLRLANASVERLLAENAALQEHVDSAAERATSQNASTAVVEKLLAENAALQERLDSSEQRATTQKASSAIIKKLLAEKEFLQERLDSAEQRATTQKASAAIIENLMAEKEFLQQRLDSAEQRVTTHKASTAIIENLMAEKEFLQQRIERIEARASTQQRVERSPPRDAPVTDAAADDNSIATTIRTVPAEAKDPSGKVTDVSGRKIPAALTARNKSETCRRGRTHATTRKLPSPPSIQVEDDNSLTMSDIGASETYHRGRSYATTRSDGRPTKHSDANKLPSPPPSIRVEDDHSLTMSDIDATDTTIRPSQPPSVALATVIKQLEDEIVERKGKLAGQQRLYNDHNAALSRRRRQEIKIVMDRYTAEVEKRSDQIYALYDVLEGQKQDAAKAKKSGRLHSPPPCDLSYDDLDSTLQSVGMDAFEISGRLSSL